MEPIQIVGIKDLDDMEIDAINRLANRFYPKFQREVDEDVGVTIHVKKYKKEGTQCKYDVHLKVRTLEKSFVSTKSTDWDLNAALHKSFEDIIHQMHHKLHTDEQHKPWMQSEAKGPRRKK